jgi:predicted DNA-binding ribbon-helix-helix protein
MYQRISALLLEIVIARSISLFNRCAFSISRFPVSESQRKLFEPVMGRGASMNGESQNTQATAVIKRSLCLHGKKTSVSLENEFWLALHEAAAVERTSVPALVERIDHERTTCNLSSAIRVFVFHWLRQNYLMPTAQQSTVGDRVQEQ